MSPSGTAAPERPSASEPPAPGASSIGPSATTSSPSPTRTLDRFLTGTITVAARSSRSASSAWQVWSELLGWSDIDRVRDHVHRHRPRASRSASTGSSRTARSRPSKAVRAILAALGSAAIEGPVISWVADHRKHHAFSDQPGDPHSPHVDHGHGLQGRAARPAATPTSAGCSSTPSAASRRATRRT